VLKFKRKFRRQRVKSNVTHRCIINLFKMFQLNEQLCLKKCSLLRMCVLCHRTHRSNLQIVENKSAMAGITVILPGIFRQTLALFPRGTGQINFRTALWHHIHGIKFRSATEDKYESANCCEYFSW